MTACRAVGILEHHAKNGSHCNTCAIWNATNLGRQAKHVPLRRPDELATHVDDQAAAQFLVEHPPADAISRLDHDHSRGCHGGAAEQGTNGATAVVLNIR